MGSHRTAVEPIARPQTAVMTLRGHWLGLARMIWALCVLLQIALVVAAIPAYYLQLRTPPEAVRAALAGLGLSTGLYAAYLSAVLAIFSLGCFAVAAVVVWRRSRDAMALIVSLLLATMGAVNAPYAEALEKLHPILVWPVELSVSLLACSLLLVLFLFPDNRFVPRRALVPVAVWIAAVLVMLLGTGLYRVEAPEWFFVVLLGGFGAGVAAQIYRYIRVSDRVQRQQTKWVVFGVASALAGQLVFGYLAALFPASLSPSGFDATPYDLVSVTGVTFSYLLIPLSIGIAILRYRLWDIDIILNRTLVYGTLTIGVVALYVLAVAAFGTLFARGAPARDNLLISLLATGLVAVLFAPLRDHLQRGVNRLLYGERDEPYAVLARLGRRLEGALAPETTLPTIVRTIAEALKLPYAAIALREGETYRVAAAHGFPAAEQLSLPLVYGVEHVGRLLLAPRAPGDAFSVADRRLLEDLARQAGVAIHAVRLTAELQRAREHLVTAREEERRRLRNDLHDGLGPQLASLSLKLETARNRLTHDPLAAALLDDLAARTQAAVAYIRRVVYALRPPALDDLGLVSALREQAAQYQGVVVSVEVPADLPALPAAVEVAVYRIVQE
ncbi:MAG TPA: histidine kinase, partial [Herpetosiphonaceae bacterium]|nr:histidine kinase [Herpetosiphonaceae bacterium]